MKIEYQYKGLNTEGQVVDGFQYAENEIELNKDLKADGINLISADPVSKFSPKVFWEKIQKFGTVSMRDKILLYRNLASMLEAGLSLNRSLAVIIRQSKNKKLKDVLEQIQNNVKKGSSFSASLEKFPKTFTPLMVSMVKAGEESGKLVESLNVTSEQMEKTYTLKKKIKGAMIYPGVIITAMLGIAFFMLIYIVPTLTGTFTELNVDLPASTKLVIAVSDFLQNNLLLSFALILAVIFGFVFGLRTKTGVKYFSWLILRLPIVSSLVKKINSARTTRTLGSLLSSGVSFIRSLEIVEDVVQNPYYKEVIKKSQKNVQLGQPISKVFEEAEKLYPIFVSEMMAVGEETGEFGDMMFKVAKFYEEEVDQQTKNMSTIIEPVLMIVVGAAVGFFAISMISPMYTLVENI